MVGRSAEVTETVAELDVVALQEVHLQMKEYIKTLRVGDFKCRLY